MVRDWSRVCYADTSLTGGFQSLASQRFKNEVARIEQALGGTQARGGS